MIACTISLTPSLHQLTVFHSLTTFSFFELHHSLTVSTPDHTPDLRPSVTCRYVLTQLMENMTKQKPFKERVQDYNDHLSKLTDQNEMPKISG